MTHHHRRCTQPAPLPPHPLLLSLAGPLKSGCLIAGSSGASSCPGELRITWYRQPGARILIPSVALLKARPAPLLQAEAVAVAKEREARAPRPGITLWTAGVWCGLRPRESAKRTRDVSQQRRRGWTLEADLPKWYYSIKWPSAMLMALPSYGLAVPLSFVFWNHRKPCVHIAYRMSM